MLDGRTYSLQDDTKAINDAIRDGSRCKKGCYGSRFKNAIVYFPRGTYLVSSPIVAYYGTQMIGDPTSRPIIKAAPSFLGLGVIPTDVYTGGGKGPDKLDQECYINTVGYQRPRKRPMPNRSQANFYRQIRNFAIDIRQANRPQGNPSWVAGMHYQVAQATSLFTVEFRYSTDAKTQQRAICQSINILSRSCQ
jgi:hypothetical protein